MNNAVFGKTMENVQNHVDVKLLTKWDRRYGAEAKPNFHSRSVFSENLIAIEMRKFEMKFNKLIYVGMCIFDISKICLYEFHRICYRCNKCKIMYTDTNSLIYHIECDNVYDKRDIAKFDTSDYPATCTIVLSLTKEYQFVGLRAKMYAFRVDDKKDTKKVKSVKNNIVVRNITFDDYTRDLLKSK